MWDRRSSMNRGGALAMAMLIWLQWAGSALAAEPEKQGAAPDKADFGEVRQEMRELGRALSRYGMQQRDKALERGQTALDALDRRMQKLEEAIENNWEEMSEAARKHARETMRELRRQRQVLAEKYGALKNSSEGAWEQMREGFPDGLSTLNEAWERSIQEFRKEFETGDGQDGIML